ncbi:MAG: hypothetical protein KGL92_00835 [Gammaproteobacteria bacterium]|nr:hypothetical protein [Gammaproteobacteria bacterium]MDE2347024.1 hypothetical protein [Gammaproteobacteria bacterium]
MDYQSAENQVVQLQTQADQVAQGIQGLSAKLQAKITDPSLARELVLDLREAALAVQKQNQTTMMLVEQMAQYIHALESHVANVPQPGMQPRGWSAQPYASSGGGFMGNVMSGLGMGAGFGLANDLVSSIFNAF